MQPRLIAQPLGQYEPAEYQGNPTGFDPIGTYVIILPDQAAKKTGGGVLMTEDMVERMTMSATAGVLIAVGPDAFTWTADRLRNQTGDRPQPGDRVVFERFCGSPLIHEGLTYRVCEDKNIGAFGPRQGERR